MGLPAMNIKFVARAQNSAKRLDRGSVGMVLKDAKVPSGNPVTIFSSEDIPEELGTDNKNQIALALRGNDKAPQKVVVYVLATAETDYSKAFKYFERKKVDWMCFPSAKKDSQTQKITDWVKAQREAHNRVKAVLPETEAFGGERVRLKDCIFTEIPIADWEAGKLGEESIPFNFSDFDVLDAI